MVRGRQQAQIPIGDLARHGAKLAVWCQLCGRHRLLHVAPLIIRLGRSTPLDEVARQLKCSACGSRQIEARPHYPSLGVVASHAANPRKS
jgi:hypothetical protein